MADERASANPAEISMVSVSNGRPVWAVPGTPELTSCAFAKAFVNATSFPLSIQRITWGELELVRQRASRDQVCVLLTQGATGATRYIMEVLHPCWSQSGCFLRDGRGGHDRDYILSDENLMARFTRHMKKANYITIDHMVKFVNGELVDEPDKFLGDPDEQARLDKFGFKDRRVSRDAVYHWMLKAGCTLEVAGQCYYTDRHNDEDVVKFRQMSSNSARYIVASYP